MSKDIKDNVCEEATFNWIYKQQASDLYRFLYYKFGSLYDPNDKVQEAFIKLWQKCKDVPPSKAKSFLFTIANNLMLNEAKHQKIVLAYQRQPANSVDREDPEFRLREKEYLDKYQKALSKLSEGQRVVFLLNRIEGKRHQEIAELLNISRKAVEKRLYTALEKLRKEIDGIR